MGQFSLHSLYDSQMYLIFSMQMQYHGRTHIYRSSIFSLGPMELRADTGSHTRLVTSHHFGANPPPRGCIFFHVSSRVITLSQFIVSR